MRESCPGRVPSGDRTLPAPSHCRLGRDCGNGGSGGHLSRGGSIAGTHRARNSHCRGIDRFRRAWSTHLHQPIELVVLQDPTSMASMASRIAPSMMSRLHRIRRPNSRASISGDDPSDLKVAVRHGAWRPAVTTHVPQTCEVRRLSRSSASLPWSSGATSCHAGRPFRERCFRYTQRHWFCQTFRNPSTPLSSLRPGASPLKLGVVPGLIQEP